MVMNLSILRSVPCRRPESLGRQLESPPELSKRKLHGQLNFAGRQSCLVDESRGGNQASSPIEHCIVGVGWGKIRVIEKIVSLRPKLEVGDFGNAFHREALENREVHVHQAGANQFVPASVSNAGMTIDQCGKNKALQLDVTDLLPRRWSVAVAAGQPVRKIKGYDTVEPQRVSTDAYAEGLTSRGMKDSAKLPSTGKPAKKACEIRRMRNIPHRIDDQVLSYIRVARTTVAAGIDIKSGGERITILV